MSILQSQQSLIGRVESSLTDPSAQPMSQPPADQAQQLRELVERRKRGQADAPVKVIAPARSPARSPAPVRREVPSEVSRVATPPYTVTRPATNRAKVIAVTSGKGGVGKTNIAVNLATRFAQAGKRVVLLDADMGLANADVLCGMELQFNLAHVLAKRKKLSEVIARAPGGFFLVGGASGLAKMADLPAAQHTQLINALCQIEKDCDIIMIDTGAGISPNVLSFTRMADQVLVVTTPEPTAITDAYAVVKVISRERQQEPGVQHAPISLLVNQSQSAGEGKAVYERVSGVARQFLGIDLQDGGYLPQDKAVTMAVRKRVPFILDNPRSAAALSVTQLAMRLEAGVTVQRPETFFGRLSRLFRRGE